MRLSCLFYCIFFRTLGYRVKWRLEPSVIKCPNRNQQTSLQCVLSLPNVLYKITKLCLVLSSHSIICNFCCRLQTKRSLDSISDLLGDLTFVDSSSKKKNSQGDRLCYKFWDTQNSHVKHIVNRSNIRENLLRNTFSCRAADRGTKVDGFDFQ